MLTTTLTSPTRFVPRVSTLRARVLLAEDDDELRHLLATVLRQDGYLVHELRDGAQLLHVIGDGLLEATHPHAPDLIISDVRMPGASGLAVLAGLRQARWTTPVILMTAFGDADVHADAHRLGAVIFDKPFDLDDLRTAALHLTSHVSRSGRPPHAR